MDSNRVIVIKKGKGKTEENKVHPKSEIFPPNMLRGMKKSESGEDRIVKLGNSKKINEGERCFEREKDKMKPRKLIIKRGDNFTKSEQLPNH